MGVQPRATRPLNVLFSQHTGCALQSVPLTPIMVRGEQVKPTWAVTPARTTPRRPSRVETPGVDDDWTELQQCWLLTLHWDKAVWVAVVVTVTVFVAVGLVVGEATARRGKRARAATLVNNIIC